MEYREYENFRCSTSYVLWNLSIRNKVYSHSAWIKNKLQPPHLPPLYCVCGATGNHKIWFFPVVEMLYYVFPDIFIYLRYIVALTVWRPTFFTSPLLLCLHVFNFFFFVSLSGFFFHLPGAASRTRWILEIHLHIWGIQVFDLRRLIHLSTIRGYLSKATLFTWEAMTAVLLLIYTKLVQGNSMSRRTDFSLWGKF